MKILLLDDNAGVAESMMGALAIDGHVVTHADSVAAAAREYQRVGPNWYEVLICDYELPDGTGLDFLAGIAGSDRARTVIMSGEDRTAEVEAAGGADRVILKGVGGIGALFAALAEFEANPR